MYDGIHSPKNRNNTEETLGSQLKKNHLKFEIQKIKPITFNNEVVG